MYYCRMWSDSWDSMESVIKGKKVKVWESMWKYEKVWESMREYEKVWESMRKYHKVWESMRKCA